MNKLLTWFDNLRYWVKCTLYATLLVGAAIAFPVFVAPLLSGEETNKSEKACMELKHTLDYLEVAYVGKSCKGFDGKMVQDLF